MHVNVATFHVRKSIEKRFPARTLTVISKQLLYNHKGTHVNSNRQLLTIN